MESKYLSKFKKLPAGAFPLRSNRVLFEMLPREEFKTAGGLIMNGSLSDHKTSTEMNRGNLAIVLAVGDGYWDGDEQKLVPLEVEPGNVVMIGAQFGLQKISQLPGLAEYTEEKIAVGTEGDIMAAWPNVEAYLAYREALNS